MSRLLTLKTKTATVEISDDGSLSSVKLKNGKEMISGRIPMMAAIFGEIGTSWNSSEPFYNPSGKENV